MRNDLVSTIDVGSSLPPAARTATATGAGVDTTDFHAVTALVHVGVWTDGAHTFSLEESEDNSAFSAVAAGDLVGTLPVVDDATTDGTTFHVGYFGTARYLRVRVAVTGSPATGLTASAAVIRGVPRSLPTT